MPLLMHNKTNTWNITGFISVEMSYSTTIEIQMKQTTPDETPPPPNREALGDRR